MSKAKKLTATYLEVVLVFIILCAVLLLGSLALSPLGLAGTAVTELAMLAAVVIISRMKTDRFGANFPMNPPKLRPALTSIWIAVGMYFLISAANAFISAFDLTNTTDLLLYEKYMRGSSPVAVILTIVIIPAFCEELIFRGFFLNKLLRAHRSPVLPIIVSGLLFGLLHFDLFKLPATTLMGIGWGYIAYKTGSVMMPMIFHMLNNASSVVALYSMGSPAAEGTIEVIYSPQMFLFTALIMLGISIGPLFSGLRRFGSIKPKLWLRILCPIICILIVISGFSMLYTSIIDTALSTTRVLDYPEQAEYTETFTIKDHRYCSVALSASAGNGVYAEFTLTDAEGEVLYELAGNNCIGGTELVLAPGEYTVKCSLSPAEGNTVKSFKVLLTAQVIQSYRVTADSAEESSDTAAVTE